MRATGDLQKCHLQFWRIKYHRILSSKNFHRLKVDRLIESSPAGASFHGNPFFLFLYNGREQIKWRQTEAFLYYYMNKINH